MRRFEGKEHRPLTPARRQTDGTRQPFGRPLAPTADGPGTAQASPSISPATFDPASPESQHGTPLPGGTRQEMETKFGLSFADIRVHDDSGVAEENNALALTRGLDLHFARGQSVDDRFLLGHELTHVVQQRRGGSTAADTPRAVGEERSLESEASDVGRRVATGGLAGNILGQASAQPLRFGAGEHRDMGDAGSGGRMVQLADDYSITYGQMTALAGDHFESIQQMRVFAASKAGPGSREEIEYALEWQLKVPGRKYSPEAKKAQEQRYYTLAGKNDTHFPNPNAGDTGRSTADKAGDVTKSIIPNPWWPKGKPQNAIAAFRMNHVQAINEALAAGKANTPINGAMAADAFGSHYLTDAFSGGHIRTERTAISQYWDAKVPMFYYNFTGFLAEQIAKQLNDMSGYEILTEETLVKGFGFDGALDTVKQKIGGKGRLDFGGIVALALHDYDNDTGVAATSEGQDVTLMGDGKAGQGDEKKLAIRAVNLSVQDIDRAYAIGKGGGTNADELLGPDGLFAAERVIPIPSSDPGKTVSNPGTDWRKRTARELLEDPYFQKAVFTFCKEKAGEVQGVANDMGGAKKTALERAIISRLNDQSKCINLIWDVINWTPNTGGGVGGHNTDDNAADYYDDAAKVAGGVQSLTYTARINLIQPLLSGVWVADDEEARIWYLLDSAPPDDARKVIQYVGWDEIADELEDEWDDKFRAKFPRNAYAK